MENRIKLGHGAGGKLMDHLIHFISENIGIKNDTNDIVGPEQKDDSAFIDFSSLSNQIVITTDGHTVHPIFFKGGNIGDLAVCGTINDIAVMGAKPVLLTISMIIEEGFLFEDLKKICLSIRDQLTKSEARIVAGDTKVMPKGTLSEIVIATSGIGVLTRDTVLSDASTKVGDKVIITGTIGDHGLSLIALREGMEFETDLKSDVNSIWPEFKSIIEHPDIHSMKDPTRGGLASNLQEISQKSVVSIEIDETKIPINPQAQAIADILGLEILDISSEGRVILTVSPESAEHVLGLLHKTELGKGAEIIGTVIEPKDKPRVYVKTEIGGTRILEKPYGEPIPRVC